MRQWGAFILLELACGYATALAFAELAGWLSERRIRKAYRFLETNPEHGSVRWRPNRWNGTLVFAFGAVPMMIVVPVLSVGFALLVLILFAPFAYVGLLMVLNTYSATVVDAHLRVEFTPIPSPGGRKLVPIGDAQRVDFEFAQMGNGSYHKLLVIPLVGAPRLLGHAESSEQASIVVTALNAIVIQALESRDVGQPAHED